MAEARAETMQQERGGVCSIAVCGQLPLPGRGMGSSGPSGKKSAVFVDKKCENTLHRAVSVHEMRNRKQIHEDAK